MTRRDRPLVRLLYFLVIGPSVLMQGCSSSSNSNPNPNPAPVPGTIMQIRVTGQPVLVFDHTKDQQQSLNIPDIQITAWKEAGGTVNLMIPHYEAYRMRGPDLLHLTIDPTEIFSSTQSASQIPEDLYNYHQWLTGPYSSDGKTFYSLAHSEWYACLLNANDCNQVGANGLSATLNSWANTINSFVSTDGGATWQLNVVSGNHVVAKTAYVWTGSQPLADKVYLYALNHTGIFQPTRLVKEGSFYYSIGWYLQRDFAQINPPTAYQAPVTSYGYVLMRTGDFTNPNGWAAWPGGTSYESLSSPTIETDISPFAAKRFEFECCTRTNHLSRWQQQQRGVLHHHEELGESRLEPSDIHPGHSPIDHGPGRAGRGVQGFIDTNYLSILDNGSAVGFQRHCVDGTISTASRCTRSMPLTRTLTLIKGRP